MEMLVGKLVSQGLSYFSDRKKARREQTAREAAEAAGARRDASARSAEAAILRKREGERDAAIKAQTDLTKRREDEAARATADREARERTRRRGGRGATLTFTETGDSGVGFSSLLGG
ncbi:MAG: hypothetical protein ACRCS9_13915 [Hyphomicrobium sp.]